MKFAPASVHFELDKMYNIIDNAPVEEFIEFAKQYDIFQNSSNAFYQHICTKIKERLAKENLTENAVRP